MPKGMGYSESGKTSKKKKVSNAEKIRRARKIAGSVLNNRSPKEKAEEIRRRRNLEAKKARDKARASKKPFRTKKTKDVLRSGGKDVERFLDKGAR